MAKILAVGDVLVVTSTKTLEELAFVEKHRPKALELRSEDGKEVVFKVGTTCGNGSINGFGVSFGSASHDDNKFATITLPIPAGVTDAEKYAIDTIGTSIIKLNQIEEGLDAAIDEAKEELAEVKANITVM